MPDFRLLDPARFQKVPRENPRQQARDPVGQRVGDKNPLQEKSRSTCFVPKLFSTAVISTIA